MCNLTKTWKGKAIERRLENKKLLKRIGELKNSRDLWKNKFEKLKSANIFGKKKLN